MFVLKKTKINEKVDWDGPNKKAEVAYLLRIGVEGNEQAGKLHTKFYKIDPT